LSPAASAGYAAADGPPPYITAEWMLMCGTSACPYMPIQVTPLRTAWKAQRGPNSGAAPRKVSPLGELSDTSPDENSLSVSVDNARHVAELREAIERARVQQVRPGTQLDVWQYLPRAHPYPRIVLESGRQEELVRVQKELADRVRMEQEQKRLAASGQARQAAADAKAMAGGSSMPRICLWLLALLLLLQSLYILLLVRYVLAFRRRGAYPTSGWY